MTADAATLTDRYVESTLRRLPAHQRPDIEQELRTSIADAVEDRVAAGDDPAKAEFNVISELGDPARLAAGYADRPLHLIGPGVYLDYIRLLTAILAIVVPVVAAVAGFARVLDGGTAGSAIGSALDAAINTSVHIAFWTTLLFVVIERTGMRALPARQWTPDQLPMPPSRRARYGTVVGEIVAVALFTAFLLLSPVMSTETDANGDPIPILSPWLWQTGTVYVFVVLAFAALGVTVAKNYVRWNAPLAITGVLLSIASALVLISVAASGRLLNPAFVDAVGWQPEVVQWINVGLMIAATIAIAQAVVEVVAGFVARSWVTPGRNK